MSATAGLGAHRIALSVALTLFLTLLVAPAALAAPDFDGDGATTTDCAPLDPAVHPGALDKPDLATEDTNCDGIDGDKAKAVFVSPGGDNNGTGSLTNPKKTLGGATGAILTAKAAGKDVYLSGGTYNETAQLEDNVGLFGGYEPITGERDGALTTIKGAPAVFAQGDQGVVLQLLTLEGTQDGTGNTYGIRAIPDGANVPSRLVIQKVNTKGVPAAAGGSGGTGGTGFSGFGFGGGGGGAGGFCAGAVGGGGGGGGGGVLGGAAGTFISAPGGGGQGATGGTAANNAFTKVDQSSWPLPTSSGGGQGGPGGGGGGGAGGAGDSNLICLLGGQGGGGGTGGGGGFGGGGGQNGAGSLGAFLLNSSLTAESSTLTGGTPGNGGNGGGGGGGAFGQGGGGGLAGQCFAFFINVCAGTGANGASGGPGGPTAGVYQAGAGSGYAKKGSTAETTAPAAALGGFQGNGGPRAASGERAGQMRTSTAPATSGADFDGDGINDNADACPAQARGTGGSSNGCPARAAKLPDGDGDGVPNDGRDKCPDVRATDDPDSDGCNPVVVVPPVVQPAPPSGGGVTVLPSTTSINSLAFAKFTKLTNLSVKNLVAGTTVTVTCKTKSKKQQKKGCPYKRKRFTTSGGRASLNLRKPFAKRKVPVGTKITITIVAPGSIGKQITYTTRKRKLPKSRVLCLPPGGKPSSCA
jgi:hypothetical protein